MKRLFILASAAALMLASCAKTTVVYNEAPEEIGFKAVTGVMTKDGETANNSLGENISMGVFANYSPDGTDYQVHTGVTGYDNYLENVEFIKHRTGNYWAGATPQYWPLSGKLDFVVYAPYAAYPESGDKVVTREYKSETDEASGTPTVTNTLKIVVCNSISDASTSTETATLASKQTDWLYGESMVTSEKTNIAMPINLKHALAKITIKVTSDLAGLTITSLQLTDTEQKETLTVDYTGEVSTSWSSTASNEVNMTFVESFTATAAEEGNEATEADMDAENTCYVIPSDQTKIVMKYKLTSSSSELTYTHDFNPAVTPTSDGSGSGSNVAKWEANKHYTYDIQITANEIKFAPTETAWTDDTVAETPIVTDPNYADAVPAN